jgi:hypothetical protein
MHIIEHNHRELPEQLAVRDARNLEFPKFVEEATVMTNFGTKN